MINLYSGTPGSGKSLHAASSLYWWIRAGHPAIGNVALNLDYIRTRHNKRYTYKPNNELTPKYLMQFSQDYRAERGGRLGEDKILLVIDECQLMFNARDWAQRGRSDWLEFFSLHRHFGYRIILIAQFDRMIDRQVRSLIEYEYIHRKVSNFGYKGKIISALAMGKLFASVKIWYPMSEKVGAELFRAKKFYYRLYDTYELVGKEQPPRPAGRVAEDGVTGPHPMPRGLPDAAAVQEQK